MQNVQNAEEIQQRVINLVELYRTKVGKESNIAKSLANYYKERFDQEIEIALKSGIKAFPLNIDIPDDIDILRVNEQLLGYFYKDVAGKEADQKVLAHLLAEKYDPTVFSDEEVSFLKNHFADMVNYIIQTPNNDLEAIEQSDRRDLYLIPEEVLELVKNRVEIPCGAKVYNPFTGLAQFATLYPDCSFFCEDSYYPFFKKWNEYCDRLLKETNVVRNKIKEDIVWPWMKVALYANHIDVNILEDGKVPQTFDAIISYLPEIPKTVPSATKFQTSAETDDIDIINKLQLSYENLADGGKMVLVLPHKYCGEGSTSCPLRNLWSKMVDEGALAEIIQLPAVMGKSHHINNDFCIIIAKKDRNKNFTTLIDARFAAKNVENKYFDHILDLDSFHSMLENEGKENSTGLRKIVEVPMKNLNIDFLLPQTYVIERPLESEKPVPLSCLCTLKTTLIRDVQYNLPEDTPWITMSDLTPLYTGDLDFTDIRKANCPNNPTFAEGSEDYEFSSSGKFIDNFWAQMNTRKGCHVLDYRQCSFLDGNSDIVLYEHSAKHMVRVAVVRAIGKPYAVSSGILVFCPKDGFDANSLAALLRLPIVYRQLVTYQEHGIGNHLNDIFVPTDKRVIGDELYRMKREESVTNELGDKVQAMKTEYINEVRMRKHDMGQKVFDLINTEDLMRYYVDNRETESNLWPQIEEQLNHFRKTINELSDMLVQLSQEEHFGTPELIDLNDYFAGLQHSSNINGFKLSYHLDKASILNLQISHMGDKELKDISAIKVKPTVFIAKTDLQRVVSNILTNAQKHGFVDPGRKDYEVIIRLEFNAEKGMYQIDFRNNGKALPEGLNKMRYGIKGEKAGQTAGTGLGGSIVKSIVEHYKGDYDVLMDEEWTVIRVYLPIAI